MGALIPASEWMGFYLLSPQCCTLARVGYTDFAGFVIAGSRWARLAGIRSRRSRVSRWARLAGIEPLGSFEVCFLLPGETELGSAEEQPNKG